MRLSKKCAFALIRAWQADARMERLDEELQSEIKQKLGYLRYRMNVRTMIGSHAKQASDLCFANKFQQAAICLIHVGVTRCTSDYTKELQQARQSTYCAEKRKAATASAVNALYASHRLSEQWGVCK